MASEDAPFFDLPLNLPHAAEVAGRIARRLGPREDVRRRVKEAAAELAAGLMFHLGAEDNPEPEEAEADRLTALENARRLVDLLEAQGVGGETLGRLVRNLFECLGEGREGAAAGLRAGESPDSIQRPWNPRDPGKNAED
ncbi:MAG: hypothetical protein MH204_10515 [Fimbriimonadaceae bacterium]|nr:hypothetical protein [Fimbriimonadaceae bacterium]